MADSFTSEDYAHLAALLRDNLNGPAFTALLANNLNVILGALDAAARQWQPIETAPGDGKTIFGCDAKNGHRGLVHWNGAEWELVDGITNMPMGVGFYPTHWTALLPQPWPAAPGAAP